MRKSSLNRAVLNANLLKFSNLILSPPFPEMFQVLAIIIFFTFPKSSIRAFIAYYQNSSGQTWKGLPHRFFLFRGEVQYIVDPCILHSDHAFIRIYFLAIRESIGGVLSSDVLNKGEGTICRILEKFDTEKSSSLELALR